jgi:sugar O-acyltransferase (sialic acid O-acetyltransferase NeuD family)
MEEVIIYGASGHGKVIMDCCKSLGVKVVAFVDDDQVKHGNLCGVPVFGPNNIKDQHIILGLGDNMIRKNVASRYQRFSIPIIHKNAIISESTKINHGTVIFLGASVQIDTVIGKHCIINTSASVDHDCSLGDFVHIAPNATLCGGIEIGEGTLIGAGATIIPNIQIGKFKSGNGPWLVPEVL